MVSLEARPVRELGHLASDPVKGQRDSAPDTVASLPSSVSAHRGGVELARYAGVDEVLVVVEIGDRLRGDLVDGVRATLTSN